MTEPDQMPGRARAVETVVAGRFINRTLYIDALKADACAALWSSGRYTQLGIAESENPGLHELGCLEAFADVSSLHLMLDRAVDLTPLLAHARSLERFFCNDALNSLGDCTPFKALQHLGQRWRGDLHFAASHPALHSLSLTHFSPKAADLSSLPLAVNLQVLNLFQPGITSVAGVVRFPQLQGLSITRAVKLLDVNELAHLSALEEVSFEGCNKIQDFANVVQELPHLSKLVYSACAALPDLTFVLGLPRLLWLNILGTKVLSDDRSPIASHPTLNHIICTSTLGASHTEAQLRQALLARDRAL